MPVIREKRQSRGPSTVGVINVDTGGVNKYSQIAKATNQLTGLAIEEMGRRAVIEGEEIAQSLDKTKITSINPTTGKPVALDYMNQNMFIGRKGAEAYSRVINDRFQQEIEAEIKTKAGELALKYENDPYSAEKYEEQMTTYLESMAQSSEDDGTPTAYTNFIMAQGAQYIAATKLNMLQERQRREREKLGISIGLKNNENLESAYVLGQQGDAEKFQVFLEGSVDRNADGESANILKGGAAQAHSNAMGAAYVQGRLDTIFQGRTKENRLKIIDALQRKNTDNLPAGLREEIDALLPYVNMQTKSAITSHGKTLNTNMSAIEAVQEKERDKVTADIRKVSLNTYLNDVDGLESTNFNTILDAFNDSNLDPQQRSIAIQSAISQAIAAASKQQNEIDAFQTDLTTSAYQSLSQDIRRSVLGPLMIIGAGQGNVNSFMDYIQTKRLPQGGQISELQMSIADAMHRGDIPFDADDFGYIRELLGNSEDEAAQRIENYRIKSALDGEVTNFVNDVMSGEDIDLNSLINLNDRLAGSTLFTDAEKDKQRNRLKIAQAFGLMNTLPTVSAQDLNRIQTYITTSGGTDLGLSEGSKEVADQILAFTNDETRIRIIQELSRRESSQRTEEIALQQQMADVLKKAKLAEEARYGGVTKTQDHREMQDEILNAMGINILSPESETDEFYQMMSTTMSENLYQAFKTLTTDNANFTDQEVNTLMNHYSRLRNNLTARGVVNRLAGLDLNIGLLDDALAVRNLGTGAFQSFAQVISDLKNRAENGSLDVLQPYKAKGSNKSVAYDYLYGKYEDKMVAKELEPVVKYFARVGRDINEIDNLTTNIVDSMYLDSEYIIDPSMPVGSFSKSRFSLELTFPIKEEREEFIKIINRDLPDGYVLAGHKTQRQAEELEGFGKVVGSAVVAVEEAQREDIEVYLMPYGGTTVPQYYAYFREPRTGELRPLIYEQSSYDPRTMTETTQLTWPMFDESELKEYRDVTEANRIATEQEKIKQRQEQFEPLNEPAAESTLGRALMRSIMGGL